MASPNADEREEVVLIRDLADPLPPGTLDGIDVVVHLAARVHVMRERASDPLAEFRRVNVDGTRGLVDAAREAGVPKFVYVSSIKAVGEASEVALSEDALPRPVDPHGRSKLEAEQAVHEGYNDRSRSAAILRFPLVYGPGMKGNMLRLFSLVDRGIPLPFASARNRRSMLFLDNAVEALLCLLGQELSGVETFHVTDRDDLSTPQLVGKIAAALGTSARLLPIPPGLLSAGASAVDLVGGLFGLSPATPALDRLLGSLVVDGSRIERRQGWIPPHSVDDGIAATAARYRKTVPAR
jgi:nucleoside-diphosphate-sugar epimerase